MLVAYDGAGYAGFQAQANAPTIQGEIEAAIAKLTREQIRIRGASRTDAGAHARGQVVDFLTASALPPAVFRNGLNHHLPAAIRILKTAAVPAPFHSRRSARWRRYRYHILNREVLNPLHRLTHHLEPAPLDLPRMQQAATSLIGHRDFRAIAAGHPADKSAIRRVLQWDIASSPAEPDVVIIDCVANGFLRHQIRKANGILLEIGKAKLPMHALAEALAGRPLGGRQPATLPARGLCLQSVCYPPHQDYLQGCQQL